MTRVHLHFASLLLVSGFLVGVAHAENGIVLLNSPSGRDLPACGTYDLDGNIVVAGRNYPTKGSVNFLAMNILPSGVFNGAFGGGDGITITDAARNATDAAYACLVQPDGKIVSAGYAYNRRNTDFALVRLNPDGSPDKTFANKSGIAKLDLGSSEFVYGVALQSDGKILATGLGYDPGQRFLTARFTTKGILDTSFGQGGYVLTAFPGFAAWGEEVFSYMNGILVAGYTGNDSGDRIALARYDLNGNLDASFGENGTLQVLLPGYSGSTTRTAIIDSNNKILVGGESFREVGEAGYDDLTITRFNSDGSMDPTFGGGAGFVVLDANSAESATALAIQPDGKIVAAGWNDFHGNVLVSRFHADGSLDTSFNEVGWTEAFIEDRSEAVSVLIEPDGKILVVGSSKLGFGGTDYAVVLLRYLPDGTLDKSF